MMNSKLVSVILMLIMWYWGSAVAAEATPDVVLRWAPLIAQQPASVDSYTDICTLVDYDQDWRTNNNWYNLRFFSIPMAMYYSVLESETHYFIGYYQYYPRYIGGSPRENDMTGILAVVRKGFGGPENLEMIVTYSNEKWRKWNGAKVRLDGNGHPKVDVSLDTHEITILTTDRKWFSGNDDCRYQLVSLNELWSRREDLGKNHTFSRWGYFDSNFYPGSPVPWVWDYHGFNWLTQPSELVQSMQEVPVTPVKYLNNSYQPEQG